MVASACKVSLSTVNLWLQQGRKGTGNNLHTLFSDAIHEGHYQAERRAVDIIVGSDDPKWLAWWLTHNPTTRETWSEAAAERKTERKTVGTVLEAMAASGLTPEQERTLLLQMQARGLGAVQQEGEA